jgi:uncharacterized protein (DUF1697 family)
MGESVSSPRVRQIALLRGINLGPRNRIAMPKLRELLTSAGFGDVRTYVQSGNVVLTSDASSDHLAREIHDLVERELDLDIAVVVRTRDELAAVVKRNPLGDVVTDPKRYQVTFCSAEPAPELVEQAEALATPNERLVAIGRELYAWHPDGAARSKLWNRLAGKALGVTATARNWTTVTTLLEMADE